MHSQEKFRSKQIWIKSDFSLDTDKYSKTEEKALTSLSNHRFEQHFLDAQKKSQTRNYEDAQSLNDDGMTSSFAQRPKSLLYVTAVGRTDTQHQHVYFATKHVVRSGT
jgi:hypothetical protein